MQRDDLAFTDLPSLLSPGDLLVFNDTKVINARVFGTKATGGRVELLIERVVSAQRSMGAGAREPHAARRVDAHASPAARART